MANFKLQTNNAVLTDGCYITNLEMKARDVTATSNVTASYFIGDGSLLTGVAASVNTEILVSNSYFQDNKGSDSFAIRKELFTGSSNTTYEVDSTNTVYWDVLINGIQLAGTDFSVTSNTLTINVTPVPTDTIEVVGYTGVSLVDIPQNVQQIKNVFTNTTNTAFVVDPDNVVHDVFFNGLRLTNSDYTYANGLITLTSLTPNANDQIEIVGFTSKELVVGSAHYTSNTYAQATFASNNYLTSTYSSNAYLTSTYSSNAYLTSTYSSNAYLTSTYASNTYVQVLVDDHVAELVNSAPTTLDTLNELAAALGDDPNFATTVTNTLATKASNTYVNATFPSITGTPVDNQIAVWTGASTLEGDTNFQWTGTQLQLGASTTEDRKIEVGSGRTGDGFAYIDFVGDATYSDYGLRVLRGNAGPNSDSTIGHRGTGSLVLTAVDAGDIQLHTSSSARVTVKSGGNVGIGTTTPDSPLQVSGVVKSTVGRNEGTFIATDGTQYVSLVSNLGAGGYNPLSTEGDVGIIFTTDGNDAADEAGKGLVIAPWATDASGIKIQEDGKVGIGTTSPTTTLDVNGTITDDISDVRTPRVTNITGNTTIANEGVYYVTNNPTVTMGAPAAGTIMTLYNSSASSMTLARGSTVAWFRKGADNDTVSHTSITLGAYSTATITFFSATFAVVTGTDVS